VGLRDRILRALDTGEVARANCNDVVALIDLPFHSVPLAARYLGTLGIEADHADVVSLRRPFDSIKEQSVTVRVRRADLERAAFHLDKYLIEMEGRSWFGVAPTMADVMASSDRLLLELRNIGSDALRRPSQLPGWSICHIVAHLTQHADALVRCADELRNGMEAVMYPDGLDARAGAIEDASRRSSDELIDGLANSSAAFADSWSALPDGHCRSVPNSAPFDASTVRLRRLREIEVHGSDTGLAVLAPANWSRAFVGADLTTQWETVHRRTKASVHLIDEMGGVWREGEESATPISLTRRDILAWLLDRHEDPSLPSLITWGSQSRWDHAP
jgi:maleylpyruvate isomerase